MVLQTVGVILFLMNCCVCSAAGLWDPMPGRAQIAARYQVDPTPDVTFTDLWRQPAKAGLTGTVMGTTIGGLAMVVFGLGLQTDRRGAAWGALAATSTLGLVLLVCAVALWVGQAPVPARLWHAVLTATTVLLVGLCIAAARQIRSNPPPAGPQVISGAEVERLKRHP